jgi:hypothetical protein
MMAPRYPHIEVVLEPGQDPATAVTRALAAFDQWTNGERRDEIGPFLRRIHGKPRITVLQEAAKLVTIREVVG